MDVAGRPTLKFGLKEILTYKLDEVMVKKDVFTTIYCTNLQTKEIVETGQALQLTGVLKESDYKTSEGEKRTKRILQADLIELQSEQMSAFIPVPDAPTF